MSAPVPLRPIQPDTSTAPWATLAGGVFTPHRSEALARRFADDLAAREPGVPVYLMQPTEEIRASLVMERKPL